MFCVGIDRRVCVQCGGVGTMIRVFSLWVGGYQYKQVFLHCLVAGPACEPAHLNPRQFILKQ